MTPHRQLVVHSRFPVSAAELFAWHTREGAFERLAVPWEPLRVVARAGGIRDGGRVVVELSIAGMPVRWEAQHFGYEEGRVFRDRQVSGPFAFWEHTHEVLPGEGPDAAAVLRDRIEYEMPAGRLGDVLGGDAVTRRLLHMFSFRHRQLRRDLVRHARASAAGLAPSTIAVSGASGLIGDALCAFLTSGGHRVRRLVRPRAGVAPGPDDVRWDPEAGEIDSQALEGVDAAVHLASENVGASRWTPERKRRIRDSRVKGTRLLATALGALPRPPRVLVSASAVGFYGLRTQGSVDERAGPGDDFLAEVARVWEESTAPAAERGIRVALPRFANVLDPRGGALAKMLPIYKAGLGGRVGGGEQEFPWVALDDAVGAIHQALFDRTLLGPFNVVAPEAVTNAKFNEVLARTLGRPAVLPVPGFALKVAFGELANALLSGPRVLAARLEQVGFGFLHPTLAPALEEMLGRGPLPATTGDERQLELAL
jgi:uncharacterized protein (TIGR01777 family)